MIAERVLQALEADGATGADGLGLPGRGPSLGEEQLGVDSQTVGPLLPAALLLGHSPEQLVHGALQGETRCWNYSSVTMPPPGDTAQEGSGKNQRHPRNFFL